MRGWPPAAPLRQLRGSLSVEGGCRQEKPIRKCVCILVIAHLPTDDEVGHTQFRETRRGTRNSAGSMALPYFYGSGRDPETPSARNSAAGVCACLSWG